MTIDATPSVHILLVAALARREWLAGRREGDLRTGRIGSNPPFLTQSLFAVVRVVVVFAVFGPDAVTVGVPGANHVAAARHVLDESRWGWTEAQCIPAVTPPPAPPPLPVEFHRCRCCCRSRHAAAPRAAARSPG